MSALDPGRTTRRFFSTPACRRSTCVRGFDNNDGVYHSIYDDYYYYTKFLDTTSRNGRRWRKRPDRL